MGGQEASASSPGLCLLGTAKRTEGHSSAELTVKVELPGEITAVEAMSVY